MISIYAANNMSTLSQCLDIRRRVFVIDSLSAGPELTLLVEIYRCATEGSQFLIVTHSPILLGMPDSEILTFDDGPIHPCSYEETDSYQVTSMFVNHREHILKKLLD